LILIRDSLGLVEEGKAVPPALYQLLAQLDGTMTVRDIQALLMRERGGILVGQEEVEQLLSDLDEAFLLDSKGFEQARARIVEAFARLPVRSCALCGRSYPDEAEALKEKLDEILSSRPARGNAGNHVRALVAPHIDLNVGAGVYAAAYRTLEGATPSRVVVLGVGHHMTDGLFCLTEKDFETPFGTIQNDKASIKKLRDSGLPVISPDDFVHRSEHSIEFQTIFLQHVLTGRPFTIVPILCGGLRPLLPRFHRNGYVEAAAGFLGALTEIIDDGKGETLVVAGVDLSHTGPKFGHRETGRQLQPESESHDRALLKALSSGDPDAFWEERIGEGDRFNVCGFSVLACLMEVLKAVRGRVLDYQVWHEDPTRSAVSFSAVVFTEKTAG